MCNGHHWSLKRFARLRFIFFFFFLPLHFHSVFFPTDCFSILSSCMECQAFSVLRSNGVNVQMISQGASKVSQFLLICTANDHSLVERKSFSKSNDLILQSLTAQVNISLVVHDSEAKQCVQALHSAFFENENELPYKN